MALTRIRAQQISDIDYKQAVRVITLSNITLTSGAPNTVDGVSLAAGDRILVAGQNTGSQNGLYDVSVLGTGSNGTWVRTADGDLTGEIQAGMIVMVTEGDSYKDTQWKLTTNNPIVIGTTALVFEQNSAYAFGNIYANGTAVLANAVGGTVTLTPGDNIAITGNNTSKTVTIGVTGISLNSISNGTSNVNVTSSGGNVTVGVGGTDGIAVFAPTGEYVTGVMSVSGNVTGGNMLTSGQISASGNITGGNLSITSDAVITGNLTVNGNTTFINSNVVTTNDKSIVLANNQNTQANVSGAGIELGNNSIVTWQYNSTANAWLSNVGISASGNVSSNDSMTAIGNVTGGNILTTGIVSATGNVTGNYFIGNGALLSGIDTTLISNGTSNVKVVGSNGNVTVGIAGESNVAVFNTGGLDVSGNISATGNISGDRFLGNGTQLTGINAFGNIAVTGETTVSADSTSDILTFAEGSGIAITTDAANNTITFSAAGTDSIFATGGDMGTVDEAVTSEEDLGTVDVAASVEYDLGTIVTAGLIYPDQLVLPIYTVSTLPSASVVASFIYVSDETGGAVPAFSDGTNWRRVTDRAIVS